MTRERVRIGDTEIEIEVLSEVDAEECDWVVCVPWSTPSFFADDERGTCFTCGQAIRFRPHAPKKPPKLCMPCFMLKEKSQ